MNGDGGVIGDEWRSLSNGHGVVVGDDGVSRHGGGGFWVI